MDAPNFDDESINVVPLEMASHSPKSQRSASMTSRFYKAESEDQQVKSFIKTTSANVKSNNSDSKIRQSRHLPYWAWYFIAKCHGIPLKRKSKPILGTILHGLTFAGALTYAVSYTWFVVYDILSPNTPRDIPGGSISILLVYFWCGFGYYCKDLSSRLFLHPRFLKDIRMHTRTVFKMNGALVVFILGFFFTTANVLECLNWFSDPYCDKIELDSIVCQIMSISSVFFSVFTLIWHSLVSFIFMSVCRTHTIGIRRFIKEIEYDASLIERHLSFSNHLLPLSQDDIWQESLWIAEEEDDEEYVNYQPKPRHAMSISKKDINPRMQASASNIRSVDDQGEISVLFAPISDNMDSFQDPSSVSEYEWNQFREDKTFIPVRRVIEANKNKPEDSAATPHSMSNAELMHHFWKLNCRLRFSSYALQRWYASFVSLVLLRCSTYLVHWLGHPATMYDILQFALPLIMLVVLSTAIAEVNFEGQRLLRSIYPNELRIKPLQYMNLNPLQITVYGFGMTHGTIVTVVFAMLVGFVTKIVITEMTK
ncbi:uncharacterized protein TNIN_290451 [Trichonephila inaurata madagascariensis]|uniref:Uncharacterized protein n=1 Tax=Trichonephila inaurata madagascariensis TaxID=2747483 RepID=A0A8X7BTB9_9ARAC|nr:uncharacterized protein TNIN_290451 [Trichonephila inaurata madagascariensis]